MAIHYDAIVLGCGGMGSAVLYHLARRGLRVLGIDRNEPVHEKGSSHGRSRVIRKAYFEDPRYVPMLHRTYDLWRDLESETGERLLNLCGVLNLGPADHICVQGAKQSAVEYGLAYDQVSASEIARRWPALAPMEDDIGIFEADGGILPPESAVRLHLELAERHGATLRWSEPVREWSADEDVVSVRTERDASVGRHLVIAAGAWLAEIASDLRLPLRVERQVQLWWSPMDTGLCRPDRLPAFIHFKGDRAYYGIPMSASDPGIKISRHHGGEITTADAIDRSLRPDDETDVRDYVGRHVPAADGPLEAHSVCMYTNTPDDHFILDRHPRHENVIIAGGFSGHGFKFSPLVGAVVADLLTEKQTDQPIELFRIDRFSNPR